jgi:hypothetical protein
MVVQHRDSRLRAPAGKLPLAKNFFRAIEFEIASTTFEHCLTRGGSPRRRAIDGGILSEQQRSNRARTEEKE